MSSFTTVDRPDVQIARAKVDIRQFTRMGDGVNGKSS